MNPSPTWSIDHIGFAVSNIDEAIAVYSQYAHTSVTLRERLEKHGVEVAFLNTGGSRIELLSTLDPKNSLGQFLQKRGPGLHHIAYSVSNIRDELSRLSKLGVTLIDSTPRPGASGTLIAFLHPSSFCGILTELVEYTTS
jgi:methylmalonyl-CoA epimerase